MALKPTAIERLILANQYEILGELADDDSLRRLANQLRDGHAWLYEGHLRQQLADVLPNEASDSVLAILGI